MDKFESQSGGGHLKEGHEEGDISVRAIVWSGALLAAGAFFSFVLMIGMIWGMEKWERSREPQLTPMEKQMLDERTASNQGVGQTLGEHDVQPAPDWFGRGKMEDHLRRTFKDTSPRLQYDDEHDMHGFAGSEEKWLDSTGKSTDGSIHIPISRAMEILAERGLPQASGPFQPSNVGAQSAAYPTGVAGTGQPASTPAGGTKK